MFERYGTGIAEIIFNNSTAHAAIAKSEGKIRSSSNNDAPQASRAEAEAVLEKLAAHFTENSDSPNWDSWLYAYEEEMSLAKKSGEDRY